MEEQMKNQRAALNNVNFMNHPLNHSTGFHGRNGHDQNASPAHRGYLLDGHESNGDTVYRRHSPGRLHSMDGDPSKVLHQLSVFSILSDRLSICLFTCLFVCMFVCVSVCLSISLSDCLPACPRICVSVCLYLCMGCRPVCLCVCLPCLSFVSIWRW